MEVTVRFFSFFREYGESELTVSMSQGKSTVADLVMQLTAHLGDRFSREVGSEVANNPHLQALIYVGKDSIANLNQVDTVLQDGDIVKFLPPMAGG